jgi:hypothetical protein
MTSEENVAYINAQVALLNAEIATMQAANAMRIHRGETPAYGEEQFTKVLERYECSLGHNAVVGMFVG